MPSRTFDAVIFDMDGVLCDSEPFIAAAAAEALRRRYGIIVTHEDFLPFVGRRRRPVHRRRGRAPRRDGGPRGRQGTDLRDLPRADRRLAAAGRRGACVPRGRPRGRPAPRGGHRFRPAQAQRQPGRDRRRRVHVRRRDLRRARHPQEAGPGDVPAGGRSGWGCRPRAVSSSRMRPTASGPAARRAARCSGSRRPSPPRRSSRRGPSPSRPTSRQCRQEVRAALGVGPGPGLTSA